MSDWLEFLIWALAGAYWLCRAIWRASRLTPGGAWTAAVAGTVAVGAAIVVLALL